MHSTPHSDIWRKGLLGIKLIWPASYGCILQRECRSMLCSMIWGKRLEFQHMWEMQAYIMLNRFHHKVSNVLLNSEYSRECTVSLKGTWPRVFPSLAEKWSADDKCWSTLTQAVCAASGYTFPVWRKLPLPTSALYHTAYLNENIRFFPYTEPWPTASQLLPLFPTPWF